MLRVKRETLQAAVSNESNPGCRCQRRPAVLDDGRVVEVANVVWCTGFKQVFDWIRLPIFGDDGWPVEFRGVVPEAPGLYFCGLSFQYAFSSMLLTGVGRDAEFVAKQISATHARPCRLCSLSDARILRSGVVRDERCSRAGAGPRGLRAPRMGRGV